MAEGSQVLREARATEGEAGLEVGSRDVQSGVLREESHDLMRVDLERLADPPHLVGERDLERVERVAAVLEHLRGPDRADLELSRQMREGLTHESDGSWRVCADHGERRIVVVMDRRAFPEKLGLEAHVKCHAPGLPGVPLEERQDPLLERAGQHGGAKHKDVVSGLRPHRRAELGGEPLERAQVLTAVGR